MPSSLTAMRGTALTMALSPLVAIIAGVTSAVLFVAAIAAGPAGLFFSLFLSPLPVAIAGLGWSWRTAIASAVVAALAMALVSPLQGPALHIAAIGLPAAASSYFLLLHRDVTTDNGQTVTEWFPVGWVLAGIAVWSGLISGAAILLTGSDVSALRAQIEKAVDTFIAMRDQLPAQLPENLTAEQKAQLVDLMVNLMPGVIASVWLLIAIFALWLGRPGHTRFRPVEPALARSFGDCSAANIFALVHCSHRCICRRRHGRPDCLWLLLGVFRGLPVSRPGDHPSADTRSTPERLRTRRCLRWAADHPNHEPADCNARPCRTAPAIPAVEARNRRAIAAVRSTANRPWKQWPKPIDQRTPRRRYEDAGYSARTHRKARTDGRRRFCQGRIRAQLPVAAEKRPARHQGKPSRVRSRRTQLEAQNLEQKKEAEQVAEKLDGETHVAIRQAGDTGQLYGSVSSRDIAELITEAGVTIARRQVILQAPIKELGLHPVQIQLHPEVTVGMTVNVARSEEEAERQARGEDVTVIRDEELDLETFDPDAEEGGDEPALDDSAVDPGAGEQPEM